jgi:biopolymer transport protein ExbB
MKMKNNKKKNLLLLLFISFGLPIFAQADAQETGLVEVLVDMKTKFVQGGVGFMSIIAICLIFGLAVAIERIITLNLAHINLNKFLTELRNKLKNGGSEEARAFCETQNGPLPAMISQSLLRFKKGVGEVEKSLIGYGQVEMGKLEKGLSWIALFIALAPMFGFMGTVLGMVDVFEGIQKSGTIKIDDVAKGIKIKLFTSVGGLVVAVILQIFYNYCTAKLESLVNQMEEGALVFVDMLLLDEKENKD